MDERQPADTNRTDEPFTGFGGLGALQHERERLRLQVQRLRATASFLREASRPEHGAETPTWRERELLLAEVEHKLKTSLSVLAGWAVTLDDRWDVLDEGQRRAAAATVRRRAEAMADQLQLLLAEARADLAPVRPESLEVDEVLGALAERYRGPDARAAVAVGPAPDLKVFADPDALGTVLDHLVDNAIKYSPSGSTVEVNARRENHLVAIEVLDEGRGIPEGIDLFAPFTRAADGVPGAGLGLYVVRRLVDRMGGQVTAERRPGSGSAFRVVLPPA